MKFHISSSVLFFNCEFLKQTKYMMGAVMTGKNIEVLPAKVINSGTSLCVLSINNVISTGTRIIWTSVNFFRSMLSVNLLPFLVVNKRMMKRIAGAIHYHQPWGNCRCILKYSLKERIPVNASQTTSIIATVALFFTALINNKKVRITVSKKIRIRLSARFVSIYI
jgi:hypothetical protein